MTHTSEYPLDPASKIEPISGSILIPAREIELWYTFNMNKLYVIGGSPRCGKTTIMNQIIAEKPMVGVSSDAVRAGVRYLNKNKRIEESEDMVEDILPWEIMIGLIQRYDHQNIPVIVEGVVFTPARVRSLQLKNLELRVAFVGFSSDNFIEQVIEHGKKTKDWVHANIEEHNGQEDNVRGVMKDLEEKSIKLKAEAKEHGYSFFEADGCEFGEYKDKVSSYLLG